MGSVDALNRSRDHVGVLVQLESIGEEHRFYRTQQLEASQAPHSLDFPEQLCCFSHPLPWPAAGFFSFPCYPAWWRFSPDRSVWLMGRFSTPRFS